MKSRSWVLLLGSTTLALMFVTTFGGPWSGRADAKNKNQTVSPNDPTYRVFQILDREHGGKLEDLYILADIFTDPKNPDQQLQRVIRVDYGKNRAFGKLRIDVRTVAKMDPAQLKTYTPKQVYDFAVADVQKFVKTDPGPFGVTGDLYLVSDGDRPLASAGITDDARKEYDTLLTQYLLPALEKK